MTFCSVEVSVHTRMLPQQILLVLALALGVASAPIPDGPLEPVVTALGAISNATGQSNGTVLDIPGIVHLDDGRNDPKGMTRAIIGVIKQAANTLKAEAKTTMTTTMMGTMEIVMMNPMMMMAATTTATKMRTMMTMTAVETATMQTTTMTTAVAETVEMAKTTIENAHHKS